MHFKVPLIAVKVGVEVAVKIAVAVKVAIKVAVEVAIKTEDAVNVPCKILFQSTLDNCF